MEPDAAPWWQTHPGEREVVDLVIADSEPQCVALAQARAAIDLARPEPAAVGRLAAYVMAALDKSSPPWLLVLGPAMPTAIHLWQRAALDAAFRLAWAMRDR